MDSKAGKEPAPDDVVLLEEAAARTEAAARQLPTIQSIIDAAVRAGCEPCTESKCVCGKTGQNGFYCCGSRRTNNANEPKGFKMPFPGAEDDDKRFMWVTGPRESIEEFLKTKLNGSPLANLFGVRLKAVYFNKVANTEEEEVRLSASVGPIEDCFSAGGSADRPDEPAKKKFKKSDDDDYAK